MAGKIASAGKSIAGCGCLLMLLGLMLPIGFIIFALIAANVPHH